MDKMFGWFKHWQNSEWTPRGIAKKMVGVGVAAGVAVGAVSFGTEPAPVAPPLSTMQPLFSPGEVADGTENWLQRRMSGAKKWVKRHPAITGTVAGCVTGSVVPIIGTIVGCATGATVGYTIGSDEREGRMEERVVK